MPIIPSASTTCGGLRISTSSPYALCHQSSNGADVSMANAPQIDTHEPRGPRNPQNRTARARSSSLPEKVVRSTTTPCAMPPTTPPR